MTRRPIFSSTNLNHRTATSPGSELQARGIQQGNAALSRHISPHPYDHLSSHLIRRGALKVAQVPLPALSQFDTPCVRVRVSTPTRPLLVPVSVGLWACVEGADTAGLAFALLLEWCSSFPYLGGIHWIDLRLLRRSVVGSDLIRLSTQQRTSSSQALKP